MKKREITKEKYSEFMKESIYSIKSWIDTFEGTDKDFVKIFKIKKETFLKRFESKSLTYNNMTTAIDTLHIPPQIVGKIFFNEEPNERVQKQIDEIIEISFNQYSKEGQENER